MATRDPYLAAYRRDILKGMAGTLWNHAYIDFADEHQGEHLGASVDRPGHGESWDAYVPAVPPAAKTAAEALAELYERTDGDIVELYGQAIEADTGKPYEFDQVAGRARAEAPPQAFGHALANMALGTGSGSWFDDHKRFKIDLPSFECWFDGDELHWSGRSMGPGEPLNVSQHDRENPSRKCRVCGAPSELVRCPTCQEAFFKREQDRLARTPAQERCGKCVAARAQGRHLDRCPHKPRANPSRAELRDPDFVRDTIEQSLTYELKTKVAKLELKPGPLGKNKTQEAFVRDLANNVAASLILDDEDEARGERHNPVGRFTAKGERMYQDVKAEYEAKGDPRAAEIAARTVYAEARKGVDGLLNVGAGRPPGVPNPSGRFRRL